MKWNESVFSPGRLLVAPFTGAWIEIMIYPPFYAFLIVAPFTGAWIEIFAFSKAAIESAGRTLHGCVD